MKAFFEFFAKRHLLAMLITVMIILLGLSALTQIKRDVFPVVDFGELVITTTYPGASPEDVELNVTNKLEDELKQVSGIERMTSFSMENRSVIDVLVDPDHRDQEKVKREVRDAVERVSDFPVEVEDRPNIMELTTAVFPVIEVGLKGDVPYRVLREHAKVLEKKLEDLPGVSSAIPQGLHDREVKIEVSPRAMRKYQLSLNDIIRAVGLRNIRATGGTFESFTNEKTVVTLAQFKTPQEVGDVVVRSTFDGPLIRIRDVATVTDGFEDPRIISRVNGEPAISFIVNKKESADVIRTVDAVRELVEEMKPTFPDGISAVYSTDMSYYVRNRLRVVGNNGFIGLALVIFTLTMFLNIRSAFWVAMGIPVTVMGVLFMLPLVNSFLDIISMAALIQVIGIIVDDGIIIAENIHKYREKGLPPLKAAVEGISEVFWPVLTTIVTTFIAFAPMFFMSGIMGKFVVVIPLVVTLALFISLLEVAIALPAHLTAGMKEGRVKKAQNKTRSWFYRVRVFYQRAMHVVIRFRYAAVLLAVVMLVGTAWYAVNYMDFVLFPPEVADTFFLLVELPAGASLEATSEKTKALETLIAELPRDELRSFTTRVGMLGDFRPGALNDHWAVIAVSLTPPDERTRIADEIVEDLRPKSDALKGFDRVTYYVDAGGPPVGQPITLRVVSNDDAKRTALADSVVAYLATAEGVKDIARDDREGKQQIEIKPNYAKLARVGLTVADVAQNVRFAYDGEIVTDVRYGDEDVDFRVQLNESARKNPRFLRELLIPNQQGRLIALQDVARLNDVAGISNIHHYDADRAVTITGDVEQGVTTPVKAMSALVDHFDLSHWPGTRFVVGGEAEETQKSMLSLFRAFGIAVIGIYFVLILLFNSLTQPFIVMTAIPFGIMGVILAFFLHGQNIGFLAMMGVVGLSGVVVNDSLVLVSHINDLKKKNPLANIRDLVSEGASDRLRAVLLTSITTVVGMLPLAYGVGGADPFIAPMVLALGWGIFFATPITLGLVPCLYAIGDDLRRIFSRKRKQPVEEIDAEWLEKMTSES